MPEQVAEQVAALLRELEAPGERSSPTTNSKRERRATFNGFASPTRDADGLEPPAAAVLPKRLGGDAVNARPADARDDEGTRSSRRLSVSLDTRPDRRQTRRLVSCALSSLKGLHIRG